MTRQIFSRLAAACALTLAASAAHADPITNWGYNISLDWSTVSGDTTFTSGFGTTGTSSTLISWGATGGSHAVPGGNRSALEITATPATGTAITDGAPALTNKITHYNNVLSSLYSTLETARLIATVVLTPQGGSALPTITNNFKIFFVETPNSLPCLPDSLSVCDDVFVLTMGALNYSFDYLGSTYYASIFESSNALNFLPPGACSAAGTSSPCIGFMTEENKATPAQFAFTITSKPVLVPEPGILSLLGISLLGMGLLRRRRI